MFNPYVQAGNNMLQNYYMKFCWAPVDAPNDKTSCVPSQNAQADLDRCIEQLRPHVGVFTTQQVATKEIESCMHSASWQRLWIDGTMLLN
jgi:hypothetical protein